MERAQVVLDRSSALAATAEPQDIADVAVHLLRAAGHDDTTLNHAVRIGRTRLRREPADHAAGRAVQLLESVIAFLGQKPRHDERTSSAAS